MLKILIFKKLNKNKRKAIGILQECLKQIILNWISNPLNKI